MKKWRLYGLIIISVFVGIVIGIVIDRIDVNRLNSQLEDTKRELELLRQTKEFIFGQNLKIFDLSFARMEATGKVQNTGSAPMDIVEILITSNDANGRYLGMYTTTVRNLWPGEIEVWRMLTGISAYQSVYAIGDLSFKISTSSN